MTAPPSGPLDAALSNKQMTDLFGAWRGSRDSNSMPKKADFDPLKVPYCLSHIWLYEFLPETDDFLCHLVGEEIRAAWQRPLRGRKISEFLTEDHQRMAVTKYWRLVLDLPCIIHGVVEYETREFKRAERIAFPLADDDGMPTYILGLSQYRGQTDEKTVSLGDKENIHIYDIESFAFLGTPETIQQTYIKNSEY